MGKGLRWALEGTQRRTDIAPIRDVLEGMRNVSKSPLPRKWQAQQKKWELSGNLWAREREIISGGWTGKASKRKFHGGLAQKAGKDSVKT